MSQLVAIEVTDTASRVTVAYFGGVPSDVAHSIARFMESLLDYRKHSVKVVRNK